MDVRYFDIFNAFYVFFFQAEIFFENVLYSVFFGSNIVIHTDFSFLLKSRGVSDFLLIICLHLMRFETHGLVRYNF